MVLDDRICCSHMSNALSRLIHCANGCERAICVRCWQPHSLNRRLEKRSASEALFDVDWLFCLFFCHGKSCRDYCYNSRYHLRCQRVRIVRIAKTVDFYSAAWGHKTSIDPLLDFDRNGATLDNCVKCQLSRIMMLKQRYYNCTKFSGLNFDMFERKIQPGAECLKQLTATSGKITTLIWFCRRPSRVSMCLLESFIFVQVDVVPTAFAVL